MLSQLEQACKTYSTEFSCGLIEFDSDWQRIFVTALTFHLDQAIARSKTEYFGNLVRCLVQHTLFSAGDAIIIILMIKFL